MSEIKIAQCIMTKNDCYVANRRITPKGIVVHTTGANNPNISRYVGPDDGVLGPNKYNNHWNKPNFKKCVHAFIGKVADGSVMVYQTLPWDYRSWGVGVGRLGSYNSSHIQFEICEDNLKNPEYYAEAFGVAAKLCAYLCKRYNIPVSNIVGHYEAYVAGYGTNHIDPRHWQREHNDSMAAFRQRVSVLLNGGDAQVSVQSPVATPTLKSSTLRKGDSGAKVVELQKLLMKHGYALPKYGADGDFGEETRQAVMAFQSIKGLVVDGLVGAKTIAALRAERLSTYTVKVSGLSLAKAEEIISKYGGIKEEETDAV